MVKSSALLAAAIVFGLQACANTEKTYNVQYGKTEVYWKDLLKMGGLYKARFETQPGESIYMFGAVASTTITLPSGEMISSERDCVLATVNRNGPEVTVDSDKFFDCRKRFNAAVDVESELSFAELLSKAERAVKAEGSCVWPGYDRKLDLAVRSTGSLARLDDDRIFFVKMRCAK